MCILRVLYWYHISLSFFDMVDTHRPGTREVGKITNIERKVHPCLRLLHNAAL